MTVNVVVITVVVVVVVAWDLISLGKFTSDVKFVIKTGLTSLLGVLGDLGRTRGPWVDEYVDYIKNQLPLRISCSVNNHAALHKCTHNAQLNALYSVNTKRSLGSSATYVAAQHPMSHFQTYTQLHNCSVEQLHNCTATQMHNRTTNRLLSKVLTPQNIERSILQKRVFLVIWADLKAISQQYARTSY